MILKFDEHINENLKVPEEEVVILFTDIKGSSKLWKMSEAKMFTAIEKHEKQIIELADKYKAIILKSIGDSYMLKFDDLKDAINLAIDLQKDLKDKPIKIGNQKLQIRIGICGGKAYKKINKRQGKDFIDYFGNVVNTASRMESKVSEVGGIAFAYEGSSKPKLDLDKYEVDQVDYKEDCRIKDRNRSARLITDIHNYYCKNISDLKGVDSVTAYKINL